MVAGHVGMEGEVFGHLGRGSAVAVPHEEVDLPARGVPERSGDGDHRGP
jgi:hypothetical protein